VTERACPVNGCGQELGVSERGVPRLICPRCWRRVPNSLRLRVAALYTAAAREEDGAVRSLASALRAATFAAERPGQGPSS